MRNQVYLSVLMVSLGLGVGACDDGTGNQPEGVQVYDSTEISEEVTNRDLVDNGTELNGAVLNGMQLNGMQLNGMQLNGMQLNGMQLNGSLFGGSTYLTGGNMVKLSVVRSKLQITDDNNVTYRGNSLANMVFELMVDGSPQFLRIESVVADANDPDISYTNLSYRKGDGTWATFCKDGYGNPTEAIVIEGAYDTNGNFVADNGAIAFACRGTASAKCIVWGYKPWDEVGGVSLRNHYQACLAMVRGDYCRANTPHTVNGTPIDISDHGLPSQVQTSSTNWPVEAQWGVNGAVCFSTPRKLIYPRDSINPCYSTIPTCPADKNTWRAGALLMTQANPG